jgi:hypothetical protein
VPGPRLLKKTDLQDNGGDYILHSPETRPGAV